MWFHSAETPDARIAFADDGPRDRRVLLLLHGWPDDATTRAERIPRVEPGRLAGGFSTEIHLRTDLDGNPLDVHLTGGHASDSTQFETSLDIDPDIRPRTAMTDKGYDSQANRAAARARGIAPVIRRSGDDNL